MYNFMEEVVNSSKDPAMESFWEVTKEEDLIRQQQGKRFSYEVRIRGPFEVSPTVPFKLGLGTPFEVNLKASSIAEPQRCSETTQ